MPADQRFSSRWQRISDYTKKHPGEWCLVSDDINTSTAAHVENGRLSAFRPAGEWEAIVRGSNAGRGRLFIRWLGPSKRAEEQA